MKPVKAFDETRIPIEDLIAKTFELDCKPSFTSPSCIYKVPEALRNENKDAYTPQLISIGPLHNKNPKLKPMEKQKILYFTYFRRRDEAMVEVLKHYKKYIEKKENQIRDCYSETSQDDTNEFVRMILVDAVFIMELFLRKWEAHKFSNSDDLFTRYGVRTSFERDLLLIENQIPFKVLEKLYKLVSSKVHKDQDHSSFLDLARLYFCDYDPYYQLSKGEIAEKHKLKTVWEKPEHFADLVRWLSVPQHLIFDAFSYSFSVNAATKLKLAGITFQPDFSRCLLDVRFEKRPTLSPLSWLPYTPKSIKPHLQIPTLRVDNSTKSFFLNLMAFEQCHYPQHPYISSYITLIASLIRTKEDVELLTESGVVHNELSSDEEFLQMIRSLSKQIVASSFCYGHLTKEVRKYYNSAYNHSMATIRLVYFRDVSRTTMTIFALVAITFCIISILSSLKYLNAKVSSY